MDTTIQPPVGTHPIAGRGEVMLTVGGSQYAVRFSLAVLHDYTKATGHGLSQIGVDLNDDFLGTIAELLAAAVRRYVPGAVVPAGFELADALELMETMPAAESDKVADAIWAAIRVEENPLLAALIAKAPKASVPSANGTSTSTSLLVS
jgi:hypothetical protein